MIPNKNRISARAAARHLKTAFSARRQSDTPPGVVLYRGPSQIGDGGDVVAILTLWSSNTKTTGADKGKRERVFQPQVMILDTAAEPHLLVKQGQDQNVCGDCVFASGEGCYVRVDQAPLSVYRAWKRGRYPEVSPDTLQKILAIATFIRLGSYGDPAAIPTGIWEALEVAAPVKARIVGYSHAWRYTDQRLARWCMASIETGADVFRAGSKGWRTFRLRSGDDPLVGSEKLCPAAKEAGELLGCDSCNQCDGNRGGARRPSRAIVAHGARALKALRSARRRWAA